MPPSKASRGFSSSPPKPSSSSNTPKCPICLDDLENPTTTITCNHVYCYDCIIVWVRQRNRCPLCRTVISRLCHQLTNPVTGRTETVFDEVPAPPESTGYIIDRGVFTMVVTPVDSPLVVVEPVTMPGTLLVRYATRLLEANHTFIMPNVIQGTLFVMQDALPQVTAILESAGITEIERETHRDQPRNLFGVTQHVTYLNLHPRHNTQPPGPKRG